MDSKLILAAPRDGPCRTGHRVVGISGRLQRPAGVEYYHVDYVGQDTPSRAETDRRPSSAGPPLGPLLVQKFRQIKHDHYVEANQTGVEDGCVVGKVLNFQG